MSADEWASLRLEFKKQALLGIGYVGITRLPRSTGSGQAPHQAPPIQVLAQWVHNAEKIRKKNERITGECVSLCEQLAHDGLWACILKGQGNLINYPEDLRDYRTPGDIDVWCAPFDRIEIAEGNDSGARYVSYRGERAVIEYALMQARLKTPKPLSPLSPIGKEPPSELTPIPCLGGETEPEVRYHHVELADVYPVDVEIHHRPSFMCSPWRNRRLQRWCEEQQGVCAVRWGYEDKKACGEKANGEKNKNPFDKAQDWRQNPSVEDEPCGLGANACPSENSNPLGFDSSAAQSSSPVCDTNSSSTEAKNSRFAKKQFSSFPIPTNSFNAVYQLVHIYRHLFDEGIGLRQLLDYYFVLRSLHIEQESMGDHTESMGMWAESIGRSVSSNTEIMHTLGRLTYRSSSSLQGILKASFRLLLLRSSVRDEEVRRGCDVGASSGLRPSGFRSSRSFKGSRGD